MKQERLVRQPRSWTFPDPWLIAAIALGAVLGLVLDLPWWGAGLLSAGSYAFVLLVSAAAQRRRRTRASSQTGSSAS